MPAIMVQSTTSMMDYEFLQMPHASLSTCRMVQCGNLNPCCSQRVSKLDTKPTRFLEKMSSQIRRHGWKVAFALDTGGGGGAPDTGDQGRNINGDTSGLGRTRLGTIVRAASKQLLEKLNAARKDVPMKIFLLLLGFYTANALATILGQTGDWDVLVAGVVVAAIEGIGMLMYRKPPSSMGNGRLQSLVVMVNYWKAGVCLGLFVDAFKLGS